MQFFQTFVSLFSLLILIMYITMAYSVEKISRRQADEPSRRQAEAQDDKQAGES